METAKCDLYHGTFWLFRKKCIDVCGTFATVSKMYRSHGMGLYVMWLYDAITGGSYLSTSHDQDFVGIES